LELKGAARDAAALGVQLQILDVRTADDLERALEVALAEGAEALWVPASTVSVANSQRIAELAMAARLPTVGDRRSFVEVGGLMAYGASILDAWHRAAYYVDRILKGTKPADLPVEQPMTFDFVVNLKTAQALGITFPNEIMLQVTEVVE